MSGIDSNLPVIDISPYLTPGNDEARALTSAALHSACLKYGFFYLNLVNYIDASEPEELISLARQFFALPQEEKDKIGLANEDGARGYARLKENVTNGKADNHEGIDFYRPVEVPDKSKPLWGENQWPNTPGFREKYELWVAKMNALGLIVMEAMAVGLGVTPGEWERLRAQVDHSFWVLRIIGYPPLPNDHDGFSCGAHKDYGCLTFLYADPTPSALEVFVPGLSRPASIHTSLPPEQGDMSGTWIKADPLPNCVVCNIGEMWEVWTNGLYKSTLHRVVHRGLNYRVSIPFFFEPNFDALVEPLAGALHLQQVDPRPRHAQSIIYGNFLMHKVSGNFATRYNEG